MDIELEQTSLYIVLSVFAMSVNNDKFANVVHQDEDYFLVAKRINQEQLIYELGIWRTDDFESVPGAMFSVAHFPGVVGVNYEYRPWNSIPVNQSETRCIYGPMHGLISIFAYPDDEYELNSFINRTMDIY